MHEEVMIGLWRINMQHKSDINRLIKVIKCAKGEIPADLVLKNCLIVNVFTGKLQKGDIAISNGIIAGISDGYKGVEEKDLDGFYVLPGFIDAHMHIESSMLTPLRLSESVISHGTTCIISDPHEIANVLGKDGINFMISNASDSLIDFFFMLPSCVPATPFETSGAYMEAEDLMQFLENPYILGLAEMMNYPGVLTCDKSVLEKILLFKDILIDGHCPGLRAKELQAYIAANIRSDHESIDPEEGLEKIENGMFLMIREGSTAKNMESLLSIIDDRNFHRCAFVSDDLHPEDIYDKGHMNFILRKAVSFGLNPIKAIQMATINPATYFGMKDRGAIAPGKIADIVVVNNINDFNVMQVYKNGIEIKALRMNSITNVDSNITNTINIKKFFKEDLKINYKKGKVRVIEIIPDQIVNRMIVLEPACKNGEVISDTKRDILKICVIERHKGLGNIGLGLVKGFGIKKGAIASSISHDSHNIIAVGVDNSDIYRAILEIEDMGGGIAISCNDEIIAKVRLEIAGLMTNRPLTDLIKEIKKLNMAIKELKCNVKNPFMILSFLALAVIPELRITDKGLVDVNKFQFVPLFLD